MINRHTLTCLVAALAPAVPAAAQSREIPAPPQDRPVVIHGATVHPIAAPVIEKGYVVFNDGVITEVGAGTPPARPGATSFNATGMHLYPGLISCDTTLGLTETGAVDVTQDYREYGDVTPEVYAAVAVNPDSDLIPVTRANGILTAITVPRGGLVPGRASIIRLDGWTWESMAIDPFAGLVIEWPQTEPDMRPRWWREPRPEKEQRKAITENLARIDDLFDDAAAYFAAIESDPDQARDLRFEAMRDVIEGRRPLLVRAQTQGQIESAIAWAVRRDLRLVIVGGAEADRAVTLLREHDVPVIITGVHRMPSRRDMPYDEAFTLPARLYESGIRFAIASGEGSAHERNLNHNVATAVAFGLPHEEAMMSVTTRAAEILGIGATHGSIEPGKAATLILTSGDPLQITTDTLVAFIDGRMIDLDNRHKALYEKYREKYRQLGLLKE